MGIDSLSPQKQETVKNFMRDSQIFDADLCINVLEVTNWDIQEARRFVGGDPSFQIISADESFQDDVTNSSGEESEDSEHDSGVMHPNSSWLALLTNNWIIQYLLSLFSGIFEWLRSFLRPEAIRDLLEEPNFNQLDLVAETFQEARDFCLNYNRSCIMYFYEISFRCSQFHNQFLLNNRMVEKLNTLVFWPVRNRALIPLTLVSKIRSLNFPTVAILNIEETDCHVYQLSDLRTPFTMKQNLEDILDLIKAMKTNRAMMVEDRKIRRQQQEEYDEALIQDELMEFIKDDEEEAVTVDPEIWKRTKDQFKEELGMETEERGSGVLLLRIRYHTGRTADRRFLVTDCCSDIYRFAYLHEDAPYRMTISSVRPYRRIACEPSDSEGYVQIGELGLSDRSVLVVYDKDA